MLAPEAFRLERQVVQEERRRRVEDQPIAFLWEQLQAVAYQAHPYGWPVIGWSTDLQKLTLEEAQRFYDLYYVPNNAFLVVVGQFEDDVILDMIRRYFGPIPPGAPPPAVAAQEPEQYGRRRVTIRRPAQLPYVAVAYHVPAYDHDDAYALEIMAELLGGGQSARLVQTLQREKQLVLSTGAAYGGIAIDPPLLTVSAQPAPVVPVAAVEAAVWEVIDALKQKAPSPAEVERVKRHLTKAYVIRLDSQFARAMALGQAEMALTWQWLTGYLSKLAAVTPEDVQRVARTYLKAENRTVGILEPLPLTEAAEQQQSEPPLTNPVSTPGGHVQ